MCPNYAMWLNPLQCATYAPVTSCAIIISQLQSALHVSQLRRVTKPTTVCNICPCYTLRHNNVQITPCDSNPLHSAPYVLRHAPALHASVCIHYIVRQLTYPLRTASYVTTTSCAICVIRPNYILCHEFQVHAAPYVPSTHWAICPRSICCRMAEVHYASYVPTTYYTTSSKCKLHYMSQVHTVPHVPLAPSAIWPKYIMSRTFQLHTIAQLPRTYYFMCSKHTLYHMCPLHIFSCHMSQMYDASYVPITCFT